jgi:hypothetical protein
MINDAGYWILDTGYWILDTGYWMKYESIKVQSKVIHELTSSIQYPASAKEECKRKL